MAASAPRRKVSDSTAENSTRTPATISAPAVKKTSAIHSPVTILDAEKMRRAIARICYEISERNDGLSNVMLVGIRTRGAFLAQRMQAFLAQVEETAVPVVELDITNYRDDLDRGAKVMATQEQITGELPAQLNDYTVVLVDDVLYTGRTTRAAMDAIMDLGRPQRIQLAVLVDRGHRELPIRADFIGKNLPTSCEERVVVQMREVDGIDAVVIGKGE